MISPSASLPWRVAGLALARGLLICEFPAFPSFCFLCSVVLFPMNVGPDIQPRQRENTLLGERLLTLERKLQALEQEKEPDKSSARRTRSVEGNATTSTPGQVGLQSQTTDILERSLDRDDVVDGMGSVALTDEGDEREYFGKPPSNSLSQRALLFESKLIISLLYYEKGTSSNIAFLSFVVRAVGKPVNAEDHILPSATDVPIEHVDDLSCSSFLRRPISNTDNLFEEGVQRNAVQPFALPAQNEAEHLLRLYFTTVNLMVPCIHEESFRATHRMVRSHGPNAVRRPWLGILNMIFAIATNVLTPTSPLLERATQSKMYFERAVELMRPDMLRRLSLDMGML